MPKTSLIRSADSIEYRLMTDRHRAIASTHASNGIVRVKTVPSLLYTITCWLMLVCLQEGMQAALAADFSMTQFNYLGRLLLVHGRYR